MDSRRRRLIVTALRSSTLAHESDRPRGEERARPNEFTVRKVAEMKRRQAQRHAAKFSPAA